MLLQKRRNKYAAQSSDLAQQMHARMSQHLQHATTDIRTNHIDQGQITHALVAVPSSNTAFQLQAQTPADGGLACALPELTHQLRIVARHDSARRMEASRQDRQILHTWGKQKADDCTDELQQLFAKDLGTGQSDNKAHKSISCH